MIEIFEKSAEQLSTFEHLIEKDENGGVEQYKIG